MMRLTLLLAILLAGPALSQSKPAPGSAPASQGDPVTNFSAQDEVMNAAMAEAVATLPLWFQYAMTADGQALPETGLKVAMPAGRGGYEIIWVHGITRTPSGFAGYLSNAPVDLGPLREGDYVEFTESQIRDWSVRGPTGLRHGHYTTRVIAALPGNEYIWPLLAEDPIPAGWR